VEDVFFFILSGLVDRWRQLSPWEKENKIIIGATLVRFFASSISLSIIIAFIYPIERRWMRPNEHIEYDLY
jgi:hypothetical protein